MLYPAYYWWNFLGFLAHPAAGQIKNAENRLDFPRCISRCSGKNPPADAEVIQRVWEEMQALSQSIIDGYVSVSDLKDTLSNEYGVDINF